MDWNTQKQSISTGEWMFDGALEQSVESDYLLPDYLPDIARVLKCRIIPTVAMAQMLGDTLTVEGSWQIRLYYLAQDGKAIHTAEVKYPFSKTQEIKNAPPESAVETTVHTDYCNCRVVNKRRIDVRGAVTIGVRVLARRQVDFLCDATGSGIELQKETVQAAKLLGILEKQFSVSEPVVLEGREKAIDNILFRQAYTEVTDRKLVTGKAILKGVCHLLLLCQTDDDTPDLFALERDIPFSQIVETEGDTEDTLCHITVSVLGVEAVLPEEGSDSPDEMTINLTLLTNLKCYAKEEVFLIRDAYSTQYEITTDKEPVAVQSIAEEIDESGNAKEVLTFGDNPPVKLHGVVGEIDKQTVTSKFGEILLQGDILYTLLGEDAEGNPSIWEKSGHFEIVRKVPSAGETFRFDGKLTLRQVRLGNLTESGVEVLSTLQLSGLVINTDSKEVVSEIQLQEDHPKQKPQSGRLILYFADESESLWEIAKHYNLSITRLVEENDLPDEKPRKAMLLIPTV